MIFEIGGQDSKVTIVRDGAVVDFSMNLLCAAGTGSFLDSQARRLNITIEELSTRAMGRRSQLIVLQGGVSANKGKLHILHQT